LHTGSDAESSEEEGDEEMELTISAPYHRQVSDNFEEMGDIGLGNDPIRLETLPAEDHSDI